MLSVSPRRWNGANISSRRSAATPAPWSIDADLGRCRRGDCVATRTRVPGGAWRAALASTFTSTRCSSTGSATQRRQVGVEREIDVVGPEAELLDGGEHHVGGIDRLRATPPARPACTRLTSSRSVTSVDSVGEALVGGLEQLAPVLVDEVRARGAQAADRRDGGGERAAEVVAHRGEQRGAHLVGLGERARFARGLGEVGALEGGAELGDDHVEQAPLRGIQLARRAARGSRAALRPSPTGTG